ncbi:MAG TPA: hypothetical protein VIK01_04365 [Polyangiaceae bacterium]
MWRPGNFPVTESVNTDEDVGVFIGKLFAGGSKNLYNNGLSPCTIASNVEPVPVF